MQNKHNTRFAILTISNLEKYILSSRCKAQSISLHLLNFDLSLWEKWGVCVWDLTNKTNKYPWLVGCTPIILQRASACLKWDFEVWNVNLSLSSLFPDLHNPFQQQDPTAASDFETLQWAQFPDPPSLKTLKHHPHTLELIRRLNMLPPTRRRKKQQKQHKQLKNNKNNNNSSSSSSSRSSNNNKIS